MNGLRTALLMPRRAVRFLEARLSVLHKLMALALALTIPLALAGWVSWSAAQRDIAFAQRQLGAMDFIESTWRVMSDAAEAQAGATIDPARMAKSAAAFQAVADRDASAFGVRAAASVFAVKLTQAHRLRGEILKDGYDLSGAIANAASLGVGDDMATSWTMWSLTWRLPQLLLVTDNARSAVMARRAGDTSPEVWRTLAVFDDVSERALFAVGNIKPFGGEDAARRIESRADTLKVAIARLHAKIEAFANTDPSAPSKQSIARGNVIEAEYATVQAAQALWTEIALDARARLGARVDMVAAHRQTRALLAIFVLTCAGALAVLLARSIVRPQKRLVRAMEHLVKGDTAVTVPYLDYQNEVGDVAQAVEVFRQSLIARKDLETHLERERAALEERVTQRTRDLEAANAAKTRFVALLSHEIRTPLNGVLGMAAALSRTPLDPTQKDMLGLVTASGDVLLRLLNNAIDITRIEAGQFALDIGEFELSDVVDFAASLYRETALAKGLVFDVAVAPDAAGTYRGDIIRLRQIVQNFVSNAVKFTETGAVAVSISHIGERDGKTVLRLDVADTGIGLPANPERLFTRFTQGDGANAQRYGGAGLGLAICRELAELMGGAVAAHARPNGGAIFRLEIALERVATRAPLRLVSPPAGEAPLHGMRILAADDNAMNRVVLKTLLSQAGIDVHLVENGALALEAVRAAAFDLILMDVHMPALDGLAATRAIRAEAGPNQRTPIVALTADAMPAQIQACFDAGMNGHVAKPIQIESLFGAIGDALSGALAERAQTSQGHAAAG